MEESDPRNRISALQDQLFSEKKAGNKAGEIDTLLAIANAALETDTGLAMMHFRIAEKVIGREGARLHEAIGGQGRVLRRADRFDEAIERYAAAEQAALEADNRFARVRWMLRRAATRRAAGDVDAAATIVREADALLRPPAGEGSPLVFLGPVNLFDRDEVATLVELEGEIGLDYSARRDEEGAEDHYRSAWGHAASIDDWEAVHTWSRNAGNVCARLSRYGEALVCHDAALDAARKTGSERRIGASLGSIAGVYRSAFRFEAGGDRLHALAGELTGRRRIRALDEALGLYDAGLFTRQALAVADEIDAAVENVDVNDEFRAHVSSLRERSERLLRMRPNDSGPPALDLYLPHVMARAMDRRDVAGAVDAAQLVCDVRLALALRGEKEWKRLVSGDILENPALDLRVITDALGLLVQQDENDLAADLLQRYKAPAFSATTIRRLWESRPDNATVNAFLDATRELAEVVTKLAGVAQPDFLRAVYAMRQAGERMRELGESIRATDPILHARLGLSVRRNDLLDALPLDAGVAVVDFIVGRDATFGAIYERGTDGVVISLLEAPTFAVEQVRLLTELHHEANLTKSLGGKQTENLLAIAKILHDHLFCKLAQSLSQRGVTQLVLVPDVLTRGLPLHLSMACGREFSIPGIDTSDADFLCEVMPIEYSPSLQAVAVGQTHRRPRALGTVVGFADPRGDLVGARVAMEEFGKRISGTVGWSLNTGPAMTRAAVNEAVRQSDMVVFATHGTFSPGNLRASHLVTYDEPWSLDDMLKLGDLDRPAMLVLVACEAGAVAISPDDQLAWGIPGTLLSAGASAVLANLWPVVDVTANVMLERFLFHLGHRGYRPSAALFRAVRDLRRMKRDDALAACRTHYELLRARQAEPRAVVSARLLMEWVEDSDSPTPFASPFFWGATAIVGSGWHLPAGAHVGDPMRHIENEVALASVHDLLSSGNAREALASATRVANGSDGVHRARAYVMMAEAMVNSADLTIASRVRRRARRLMDAAARLARAEEDTELLKWIDAQRTQTETDNVVENDG